MRLAGKVAIVTGASSGIGLATARRFAEEGATVVFADIRDTGEAAQGQGINRDSCLSVVTNVADAHSVDELVAFTLDRFGCLDILINNAGVQLAKSIVETTEAEWDRLMDVNLKGVFLCSKAAVKAMRSCGGGSIVNVASELGLVGGKDIAAYCASKGGVVQLSKAMAIDHARDNIRVNCVCPGPVDTPLLQDIIAAAPDPELEAAGIAAQTVLGRLGKPGEIANAIVFVASDEAAYMTGSVLAVDGGWTAR